MIWHVEYITSYSSHCCGISVKYIFIVVNFLELARVRFAAKKCVEPRSGEKDFYRPSRGVWRHAPQKILKMIPPRLAEIDAPGI